MLAAVGSYSGDMLLPNHLEYEFNRWPIFIYFNFKTTSTKSSRGHLMRCLLLVYVGQSRQNVDSIHKFITLCCPPIICFCTVTQNRLLLDEGLGDVGLGGVVMNEKCLAA